MEQGSISKRAITGTVIVAALGYFVDVYDLLIFSILRVPSLKSLNVNASELLPTGVFLLNLQMAGMILGGIVWGIIGDKRGRISVLLGSIFLYSTANIANGLVSSVTMYGICRFISGVGLAGELGAGITLVSELMSKERRSLGTTLVASIGVMGAVFAAIICEHVQWRTAYFIGGGLGLSLLALRVAIQESGLFSSMKTQSHVTRGDIFVILKSAKNFWKYLSCIFIGLPIWYTLGILVTFSPEFGKEMGVSEPISAGRAVMFTYIALVFGDLSSGLLSHYFKNRKKVVFSFITLNVISVFVYLYASASTAREIYLLCMPMGFSVGYWSVFVSTAAEQFGTNLRATVTTTVPNFVRGAVVPTTFAFESLRPTLGIRQSALAVGAVCFVIAYFSLVMLEESFGKNLDYRS